MPGDKLYLVSKFNELVKTAQKQFNELKVNATKTTPGFDESGEKQNLLQKMSQSLHF
jgi:hypothetical protein